MLIAKEMCVQITCFIFGILFLFSIQLVKASALDITEVKLSESALYDVEGLHTVIFQAKGATSQCWDGLVRIYNEQSQLTFTLAIGGYNVKSCFKVYTAANVNTAFECNAVVSNGPYDISCTEFKPYWISWYNGYIIAGHGLVPGLNQGWNISREIKLQTQPKYFKMLKMQQSSRRSDILIAAPFHWTPQVISINDQWKQNFTMLFDRDNNTCLEYIPSMVNNLQILFRVGESYRKFNVPVVGMSLDCGGENFYTYIQPQSGDNSNYYGIFKKCLFLSWTSVNRLESCSFKCSCQCGSIYIKDFQRSNGNMKLCEIMYP